MKTFFIFVIWIMLFMLLFLFLTNPYVNRYKLYMVFGKKGSGKSTILTKLAIRYIKRGWTVYSTENIPGTYYINPKDIGIYALEDFNFSPINAEDYYGIARLFMRFRLHFFPHRPHVLLLIDEVGMIYDNRHYKSFSDSVRDFFKLQRHYYVRCYMFSQTFDVDKKLRDLTDVMYLVKNVGRIFCYGKRISKFITIKESQSDDSSNLAEGLKFDSFFFLGSRTLTFIPKWKKYFNSFVAPELPHREYVLTDYNRDKLPVESCQEEPLDDDSIRTKKLID